MDQSDLDRAKQLYSQNRLSEAGVLFSQLAQNNFKASESLAGLGLVNYGQKKFDVAIRAFHQALSLGPSADAEYGLGVIAADQGKLGDALTHFQKAVGVNPRHQAAQMRLTQLTARLNDPPPQRPPPHPESNPPYGTHEPYGGNGATPYEPTYSPTPPPSRAHLGPATSDAPTQASGAIAGTADQISGFYGLLLTDANEPKSPTQMLSRQCIAFIDSIAMEGRPRRSSYPICTLMAWLSPLILVGCLAAGLRGGGPAVPVLVLLFVVYPLWRYLRFRRTHYAFTGGFLVIRGGIVFTFEKPFAVTHIKNVLLTRGPLDRLTGNGKLKIRFASDKDDPRHGVVSLRGLVPARELSQLRQTLISGAAVLHSHPVVKGLLI
jgi:membrane protein YdbS with pleckstrin-like domain